IVDIGHLRAETADINWKLRQEPFATEFVKHCQDLLRFSEREDRYEHARAALKSSGDRFCQSSLFTGACPTSGFCVIAPRALHDQDVNLLFRKNCRFHDRLVVEIYVAGVKDSLPLCAQPHPARAPHVLCLEKLECQRVFFALGCALSRDGDSLTQWTPTPAFRCEIGFPMRTKRVRPCDRATNLLALSSHHVNRVVQKHVADLSRGFCHDNLLCWRAPH